MTHKINSNYSPVPNWCKLPYGMTFKNDATSVAVDSKDNVYVFCRGPVPLFIFDSEGNYINSWGEGEFLRPHGICVDKNDDLYLIDDQGHMIEKRTKEGKLIFRLGEKGKSSVRQSGDIFNLPTDAIVDPDTGDIFISDGYGNSRVHKFDTEGKYIKSWGEPGSDPGKFSLPHNIAITSDKRLIVADRENFDRKMQSVVCWQICCCPAWREVTVCQSCATSFFKQIQYFFTLSESIEKRRK